MPLSSEGGTCELHGNKVDPENGCPVCMEIHKKDLGVNEWCANCDRGYVVWFAPSDLWNRVMRSEGGSEKFPFVCPTCFTWMAEQAGIRPTAWVVHEEADPVRVLRTSSDCWDGP